MLFSFIPTSEAELLELVVDVNVGKEAIQSGETLVISGTIVDHAYKPMRSVEVFIRAGSDTTKTFTNPAGEFRGEIKDFQRTSGIYSVNVIASWYGMTGLANTQFRVNGDASPVSILQEKLSTDEARKYLSSNERDFEKNPIGQILFKYYHGLLDELIQEQKESRKPIAEQIHLEEQRRIAEDLRNQAIEFYNPGAGTYGGYQFEQYINSLNPEIRDLVVSQLNFTKNTFEEAQKLRDEILANGGTSEEARQVFLEMISIPKEMLEKFNQESIEEKSEQSQDDSQTEINSDD